MQKQIYVIIKVKLRTVRTANGQCWSLSTDEMANISPSDGWVVQLNSSFEYFVR